MTHALIFANGDVLDGPMVRRALRTPKDDILIIAADGGARVAGYFGLLPDVVIGDFDSLSEMDQGRLQQHGVQFERFPPEKDFTDLELALQYAHAQGCRWIRIVGGLGDRFDQTIANVYLLALPEIADCDVALVAGKQQISLVRAGEWTIKGKAGDTISLVPVGGDAQGVVTSGLQYALENEALLFGPARGISNVMTSDKAHVSLDAGLMLVIHTVGRA